MGCYGLPGWSAWAVWSVLVVHLPCCFELRDGVLVLVEQVSEALFVHFDLNLMPFSQLFLLAFLKKTRSYVRFNTYRRVMLGGQPWKSP